ncbi:DUF2812 domain-containing protein [Paenibacillus sp. sgz500992]|uniref:DUF2812 domain-containing protein n=1 Tax=Paenibacillus sp. sgz500992 TaxID=3242476 RepID=UPI0036D2D9B0
MKTVFRPFWSYDLLKTETWLTGMASQGWLLEGWNIKLRRFIFRQGKPGYITYQIGYAPSAQTSLSTYLAAEGWTRNMHQGKWTIYANERQPGQINAYPSRQEAIKRNRKISYFFMAIIVYLLLIALIPLITIGISLSQDTPLRVVKSPMWLVTYTAAAFAIALLVLAFYSVIKIRAANKTLRGDNQDSHALDVQPNPTGPKIIRIKLAWMYAPDRLEQWLENKERLGFNLCKVGLGGTLFYFCKGSPRRMNYHADYQVISDEGYLELHREAGWKNVYSSLSSLQKWTIWSREYSEGAERPEIYSDQFHRLKHARKIAISYTSLFLPMLLLYSVNLGAFIDGMLNDGITASRAWNTSIMFICMLLFGSFAGRTWLYYRRLKNSKP